MSGEELAARTILVTGGTGFIGGRLVEKLVVAHRAKVRVLVRQHSDRSRLAQFPVETVEGDITDPDAVLRASGDCSLIFNCAYGTVADPAAQRAVNVEGTRNVLEAALRNPRIQRVVHLSTLSVYGALPDGTLDESSPGTYTGDCYADTKLDSEKIVLQYAEKHRLPATVLQPTMVYGPRAPSWTVRVLKELKTRRVILVEGGSGLCNPVFVDDLVDAMLLAAVREQAIGQRFLISGPEPVSWLEFYARHEAMLGRPSTVPLTTQEALALHRKSTRRGFLLVELFRASRRGESLGRRLAGTWEAAVLKRLARVLRLRPILDKLRKRPSPSPAVARDPAPPSDPLPPTDSERPIQILSPAQLRFYAAKPRVSIRKAQELLGYLPVFDFAAGMAVTEQWARSADLLPTA